jgi:hypothetical protein
MKVLGAILAVLLVLSPMIAFSLLFNWLRRSAKKLHPREDGGTLEFHVAPGMRILMNLVLSALAAFTVLVLAAGLSQGGDAWYAAFFPIGGLLAILLAKPRAVVLEQHGIRQHRWIRGDREIAWKDIAWMRRGVNSGATYVKSRHGGRPVSFSPLLVGQSRFESEVRKHASDRDEVDEE